jgi:hypothetical protein
MRSARNTASKPVVNFESRSRIKNRNGSWRSASVQVNCRACCVTHAAVGDAVTGEFCDGWSSHIFVLLQTMIPFGDGHLRRTIAEYVEHYHRERNHQGIESRLIAGAPATGILGRIRRRPRLGGILISSVRHDHAVRPSTGTIRVPAIYRKTAMRCRNFLRRIRVLPTFASNWTTHSLWRVSGLQRAADNVRLRSGAGRRSHPPGKSDEVTANPGNRVGRGLVPIRRQAWCRRNP